MAACLRSLKQFHGVELLIYHYPISRSAPYEELHFADLGQMVTRQSQSAREMLHQIRSFSPQAVLMTGWLDRGYLKAARALRKGGVLVIAGCDRQWAGTVKQRVAQLVAPWHLHSAIDVLWVPGERQQQFAYRLGYRGAKCWCGVYCCDWESFTKVKNKMKDRPRAFLFVGRYVKEKGIGLLIDAYRQYKNRANDPWPLICVGTGPEAYRLAGVAGVQDMGFVQPHDLPEMMERASVFVLPSIHEPWGVVIQEAAAASLPLICSDACGATDHLLRNNHNGLLVKSGSIKHLANAMNRLSKLDCEKLEEMGGRSYELSKQFNPGVWSNTLVNGIQTMRSSVVFSST